MQGLLNDVDGAATRVHELLRLFVKEDAMELAFVTATKVAAALRGA
jgi:hypothetical protein